MQTNQCAYGFILKDSGLKRKAEGGNNIRPPGTAMNTEIQAIIKGLEYWLRNKQGVVRVFSDSLEAIHAINTDQVYQGIEEDNISRARLMIKDPLV